MVYILYFIILVIIVLIFMRKKGKHQEPIVRTSEVPTSFKISVVKNLCNRNRGMKAIIFRPNDAGMSEILIGHYASSHKDIIQYDSEGKFRQDDAILAYTWSPFESIDIPVAGGGSISRIVSVNSQELTSWFIEHVNPLVLATFSDKS